ncbi:hypothetical protein KM043_006880 [Ampulex compressa]|nr:hypothetical protein KM043_006880 [Ampulex compressa]
MESRPRSAKSENRNTGQAQKKPSGRENITHEPLQFVVFAACLALARAGGPAAYDIATASGDHSSIGYSQESTQKGYAGQNVVSSYSRAEDTAHSSVRVSNSHVTNDALLAHDVNYVASPVVAKAAYAASYAAPAYAAPAYAAPALAKAAYVAPATYSYAAHAPVVAKAYAAPVLAKTAYAAPAYSYAAPVLAKAAYAAPAYGYAAPVLAKATYSAPVLAKAAYGYAAQAPVYAAQAPVYAKATYGYAAPATPVIAKSYAAPVVAKAAYVSQVAPVYAKAAYAAPAYGYAAHAAPLVAKATYAAAPYAYDGATPVVHTTFSGLGTSYAW